jgi:hypothetical protein
VLSAPGCMQGCGLCRNSRRLSQDVIHHSSPFFFTFPFSCLPIVSQSYDVIST